MDWYIRLESSTGTALGVLQSATRWDSTARMDRAGSISFEMSAADATAALLAPLTVARCFALVGGVWTEVGSGIVQKIDTDIGESGEAILTVSGGDMLVELGDRHMARFYLGGGTTITEPMTPVTHAAVVAQIQATYTSPSPWTMTADPAPFVNSLVGRWNYETVLQALISLGVKCWSHFAVTGFRSLAFASTFADSGVRAVPVEGTAGAGTCAIVRLRRIVDAAGLMTGVAAFGGGNADARLTTLARSTAVAALTPGYSSPTGTFYRGLFNVAARAAYGVRERVVVFNDITPISSTDGDVQAAADALYLASVRYLSQRMAPQEFYSLEVAQCPVLLRPMQTIRVQWRDPGQSIDIDKTLNILEATTTIDAAGVRTSSLVVATVDRWPDDDVNATVGRLAQGQMYQAAPQLNANSYVISYTKPVDDAETATFRFRFDSEVTQLTRVTFDFQLLPLESTVKSIGASSTTSSADGTHTHTVADHTHSVTVGGHTHTVTLGGHTHDVTIGGHTHDVTIGNHTHTTPNHSHTFKISGGTDPTYDVGFSAAGTSGGLYHNASGSDFNYPTNSGEGGATSSSGGGTTATSSSGGGTTVTSSSGGGTTATSSSGGGTTVTSSSGGGQTSSSGGSHTHTVTPVISTVYGIFRDSSANTFGLTDLEYSVDGSTWYAFTVGVNGFANLGDGWYRVDLTALLQNATTLRPLSSNNAVQVRRKSTGATKKAMIEAQINVRTIIQAIAAL